jgi:hypothetical protein
MMDTNQVPEYFPPPQSPVTTNQVESPSYKKLIVIGGIIALLLIVALFFVGVYLGQKQNTNDSSRENNDVNQSTENNFNTVYPEEMANEISTSSIDYSAGNGGSEAENYTSISPDNQKIIDVTFSENSIGSIFTIYIRDQLSMKILYSQSSPFYGGAIWSPDSKYVMLKTLFHDNGFAGDIVDVSNGRVIMAKFYSQYFKWTNNSTLVISKDRQNENEIWRNYIVEISLTNQAEKIIEKYSPLVSYSQGADWDNVYADSKNSITYTKYKYTSPDIESCGQASHESCSSETTWKVNLDTLQETKIK